MHPYALWRYDGEKWNFVRSVGSKNIAHCSKYEKIVCVGCNPNNIF